MNVALDQAHAERLLTEFAASLAAKGAIQSATWRDIFRRVPRHPFVPVAYHLVQSDSGPIYEQVVSTDDWLRLVYSDEAVVVQVDQSGRQAISASTSPALMATMLEALAVADDSAVLEIGTGTGYNAALLCERLGSQRVSTIDIHYELVTVAAQRLKALGYSPQLAAGDGRFGYAERAPYDRILGTCSVRRIPDAWREQIAPTGGVVITNLAIGSYSAGNVRLVVERDRSAHGRFLADDAAFIRMEGDEETRPAMDVLLDLWIGGAGNSRQGSVPSDLEDQLFGLWLNLHVPHLVRFSSPNADGSTAMLGLVDYIDLSWARIMIHSSGQCDVAQGGPQRLWDRVEEAHERWLAVGKPERDRYGMTISPDGHHYVWLDGPDAHDMWKL